MWLSFICVSFIFKYIQVLNILLSFRCENITGVNDTHVCQWNYTGEGFQYQLLAGPLFVLVYTFMGIFLGIAADYYNRKNLLSACLILWSATTLMTGFVSNYWQLAVARFGLGLR